MPQLTILNQPDAALLTHSRKRCAKTCLRKHWFQYEMGLRRERIASPLRYGGAFHLGLDLRRRGLDPMEACRQAVAGYEEVPDWADTDDKIYEWMIEREKVARQLMGYWWYWGSDDQRYEVVASEQKYTMPLMNPETGGTSRTFECGGMIDGIVKIIKTAQLATWETKTCSEEIDGDSDYWLKLQIDSQISDYFNAAIYMGYAVETVIYDVIRKPTIAPKLIPDLDDDGKKIVIDEAGERVLKDNGEPRQSADSKRGWTMKQTRETVQQYGERLTKDIMARPGFYYQRREIPRLRSDIEEAKQETWDIAKQLMECRKHGRWFRNTDACTAMGRCEYFGICTQGGLSIGDEIPSGFTQVDLLHQELQ